MPDLSTRASSRASVVYLRSLLKAVVPKSLRFIVRTERDLLREHGGAYLVRFNSMLVDAWARERVHRHRYRVLKESDVRAARTSDTVFVFGSGWSLNDISNAEWAEIGRHDTFGFNLFYNQSWVPVAFHLLRGGAYAELRWRPVAEDASTKLCQNPLYRNTIFLVQGEFLGQFSNQLVGYSLLPPGAKIFRYTSVRENGPPTKTLSEGLRHFGGTLTDVVNAAYCLGWKQIVLVGVDLYDSRYFWLPADVTMSIDPDTGHIVSGPVNLTRGQRFDQTHNTVRNGMVDLMARWHDDLARDGVRLEVYNPRSLLAEVMPVYEPPAPTAVAVGDRT